MDKPAKATCRRGLRRASALALVLLGTGCAELVREPPTPAPPEQSMVARRQREAEMNRLWQDRPLTQLVATLGRPLVYMNIPGGGTPPGFVVVYEKDGPSGCIDAFTMNFGQIPTVRTYYCR